MQEVETYFSEGLTKWRDLNLTEHFSMYRDCVIVLYLLLHLRKDADVVVADVKCMHLTRSYISQRCFQQEPVVQHAGFPSEVDSGESENAPERQEQSGLPATAGVSCLLFFC